MNCTEPSQKAIWKPLAWALPNETPLPQPGLSCNGGNPTIVPAANVLVVAHHRVLVVARVVAVGIVVGVEVLLAQQVRVAGPVRDIRNLDQTADVHYARATAATALKVFCAATVICPGGFSTSVMLVGPPSAFT